MTIDNADNRPTTQAYIDDTYHTLPVYSSGDIISGKFFLNIPKGKTIEHRGVRVDLIGFIETGTDKGERRELTTMTLEKEGPGEISESKVYDWKFTVPKHDETYYGDAVQLRYIVRAKIRRAYGAGVEQSKDFAIQNIQPPPEVNDRIKMEVGIEQCLHIEFEYQRTRYALTDVVIGKIYFLRVKIKIKHMELVLIRHESTGSGSAAYNENESLGKFEIMQGAPVRGEVIPVRFFLAPFQLTPTYRSVHNMFNVRYYLNLVLIDEDDRRYFKQQEIILWRDRIGDPTSPIQGSGASVKVKVPAVTDATVTTASTTVDDDEKTTTKKTKSDKKMKKITKVDSDDDNVNNNPEQDDDEL